jgi:hypothetical protein
MEQRQLLSASWDDSYKSQCTKKWTKLLRGIKSESIRKNTAVILENELNNIKRYMGESATTQSAVGEYTKFIFPLIRRTFPYSIANNICSVQPMTAPVGAIFYYDYVYGTTKGTITAGQKFPYIENFDYTYSLDSVSITGETPFTSTPPNGTNKDFVGTLAHFPDIAGSISISGIVTLESVDKTITIVDAAKDGVLSGTVTQGSTTCTVSGLINYATGQIFFTTNVALKSSSALTVSYQYTGELNSNISEVNLTVQMKAVRAISRKIRSLMSVESIDDLKAFHGQEAEADVIAGVTSEIGLEVDNEIVMDMFNNVPSANQLVWDRSRPAGIPDDAHLRSSLAVFGKVSAKIKKASLRGRANWMVVSPEIAGIFDTMPEFVASPEGQDETYQFGTYKAGVLNNQYSVFVNVYNPTNKALMGYNGNLVYDTSYVHCPYLPIQVTPTFLDPTDFQQKKGVRTRYANALVRATYLGQVTILNL